MDDRDLAALDRKVDILVRHYADRDRRAAQVAAVRRGDWASVRPDFFSQEIDGPIVSNQIEILARHARAALGPLPQFTCTPAGDSQTALNAAVKRTKIANGYLERSHLQAQNYDAVDGFSTYGLIVGRVEPYEGGPVIYLEDSAGYYPVFDRFGKARAVARIFKRELWELEAEYPEVSAKISLYAQDKRWGRDKDHEVEVVLYEDAKRITMYIRDSKIVLLDAENPLGRCSVVVKRKPNLDQEIRGDFDDLIGIQLVKQLMQTMLIDATDQAVHAPMAAPNDVQNITFGPGEIIKSQEPEKIRRVDLNVPREAWALIDYLGKEIEYGGIVPEALGGKIDASGPVTGKGVQQLMAGYSQQIAMAQDVLTDFYAELVEVCFCMDEKLYGNVEKNISGTLTNGSPYRLRYTPAKDIAGDYDVKVTYGGVAGLAPQAAMVFLLQGVSAGIFSKRRVRENIPGMAIDSDDEEKLITNEKFRLGIEEGLAALPQLVPSMLAQGQDPYPLVERMLKAKAAMDRGDDIDDILQKMWEPPKEQPQAAPPGPPSPEQMLAAGGGGDLVPEGVNPNIASQGPGGRPDLMQMFAGLSQSGNPVMTAGVSRMQPV